jgi:glutaredoxin-related protein
MIQEAAKTVVSTTSVATNASLKKRLDALVVQQPIMLFMKGTPGSRGSVRAHDSRATAKTDAPRCGFSSKAVALLKKHEVAFGHVDVLTDDEVRVSMKEYANWPTFPQFWVQGKLVGGLDVITVRVHDSVCHLTRCARVTGDGHRRRPRAAAQTGCRRRQQRRQRNAHVK